MFREPWFRILDEEKPRVRPMAEIADGIAKRHGISVTELRGIRTNKRIQAIRMEAYRAIWDERPDLSSTQMATFFNRDSSTLRHHLRKARAA